MGEWISVEEMLPMEPNKAVTFESKEVLITDGYRVCVADYARGGGHINNPWAGWGQCNLISSYNITHWMPLPEPPKE